MAEESREHACREGARRRLAGGRSALPGRSRSRSPADNGLRLWVDLAILEGLKCKTTMCEAVTEVPTNGFTFYSRDYLKLKPFLGIFDKFFIFGSHLKMNIKILKNGKNLRSLMHLFYMNQTDFWFISIEVICNFDNGTVYLDFSKKNSFYLFFKTIPYIIATKSTWWRYINCLQRLQNKV
jgi:hypothetical protein